MHGNTHATTAPFLVELIQSFYGWHMFRLAPLAILQLACQCLWELASACQTHCLRTSCDKERVHTSAARIIYTAFSACAIENSAPHPQMSVVSAKVLEGESQQGSACCWQKSTARHNSKAMHCIELTLSTIHLMRKEQKVEPQS